MMTDGKIREVMEVARNHYEAIASLSDAIALLDMCHSFADCVALNNKDAPWCRPTVTDPDSALLVGMEGRSDLETMQIRDGRYIIEGSQFGGVEASVAAPQRFIANDTYTTSRSNFVVLTGINGSGKSTYLVSFSRYFHSIPYPFVSLRFRSLTRFIYFNGLETNCYHCGFGALWELCAGFSCTYPGELKEGCC